MKLSSKARWCITMDIFLGVRSSLVGFGGQKLDNQGSNSSLLRFYENQNLSWNLSKKRKQTLAQAVTELLHASGLQYTQVAKKRSNSNKRTTKEAFLWLKSIFQVGSRPPAGAGGQGDRQRGLQQVSFFIFTLSLFILSSRFNFFPPFSQFHLKRRAALSWIREHGSDEGVVYFADDDNSYDVRIFEEIRKTRWLRIWLFLLCAWRSHVNMEDGIIVIFDLLDRAVNSHIEGVCQCSRWASSSSTGSVLRSWETERSPASMMHSRLAVRCNYFPWLFYF